MVLGRSLYFVLWQPQEARTEAWSLWGSKQGQQATHTQICQNWAPLQLPQPPAPHQAPAPSGGWAESSQAAGLTPWTWEEGRPPAPWSGLSGAAAVWWEAGGVTGLPTAPQDVPEPPSHGQGRGCQQAGRELYRPWGASLSPRAPLYPGTRGWPGAPLPSCSTTTFLGTPAPPCWSPGTGWACQAPGFARGKGQLVLHARGALWCFLETEVHAILVEPSPHPIGAVRPERQTARLSAAGSSPQKGNGVGVRSGFRLAGGRRKELPTPAAAAGDQDAPRVHQSHCPPHTNSPAPTHRLQPRNRPFCTPERAAATAAGGVACSGLGAARRQLDALFVGHRNPQVHPPGGRGPGVFDAQGGVLEGQVGVLRELSCPLSSAGSSQSCPVARGPPGEPTWERSEVGESHCHTYSGSPQKPRGSASSRDPLSFFCHQEKSLAPAFSVLKMTRRGGGGSGLGTSAREGTWGGGRASLAWRCVQGYLPRSGNASAGPETLELAPHGLCSRHPENCVFRRIRWRRIKQCPCGRESQSGCCPSLGTSGEVSVVRPVGPALGTDPRMFPEGQAAGGRVRIPGLPPGRWELVGNVPKWAQVVLLEGPTGRGPPTATEHEVHSDLAACLTAPQGCPALLLYTDRSPACRPCDAFQACWGSCPRPTVPALTPSCWCLWKSWTLLGPVDIRGTHKNTS